MIENNIDFFYQLSMSIIALATGIYAVSQRKSVAKKYGAYILSNKESFITKLIRQNQQKQETTFLFIGIFFIVLSILIFFEVFNWFIK